MKIPPIIIIAAFCMGFAVSCAPKPALAVRDGGDAAAERTPAPPPAEKSNTKRAKKTTAGKRHQPLIEVVSEERLAFAKPEEITFEKIPPDDISVLPPEEFFERETIPTPGGTARIYLQRGFMDDAVSDMVRLNPFGDDGTERRIFKVTDSTHRRLELTLTGEIRRANGRKATALDFIELWSRFMKARPAQGLALFRNVQGAEEYVTGKTPLVNGFNAADEHTIRIRFAKPDPLAFERLNSPKLIGGPFMLGSYYTGGARETEYRLLPNANSLSGETAFLRECVVTTGGDPDPLGSFAQGKYAAMTIYAAHDLQIARTEFEGGKAALHKLPSDRYFLSCKADDIEIRKFIRRSANGADLLQNAVGAEGEEIGSVAERSETVDFPRGHIAVPQLSKPFRLIYRSDDPISAAAAEKIAADLNAAGMITEAAGHAADKYETAIVRGQYDCAMGWVSETILENKTEQLHFATIWFADEADHAARVRDYREIPLFSVNNYLLLRENARLYQNRVSGLWMDMSGGSFGE